MVKVLAITQARYGSTRLPAKILKEVNGITLLEIHLRRILQAKSIDKLKIATTDEEGSKYIVEVADKVGVGYHKGSVDDVLTRFYDTASPERPDYVVRLTSDCPLIDPSIIDEVVNFTISNDYDYVITDADSFPDGLDTEVMKFSALEKAYYEANMTSEREHVAPYIRNTGSILKIRYREWYQTLSGILCRRMKDGRIKRQRRITTRSFTAYLKTFFQSIKLRHY